MVQWPAGGEAAGGSWERRAASMIRMRWVVALVVMATGGTAVAEIINVPGDQPTIQAAINAADDGDQIIVAPNLY